MKQDMKSLITRYDSSSGERDRMQSDREANGGGLVDDFTIFDEVCSRFTTMEKQGSVHDKCAELTLQ